MGFVYLIGLSSTDGKANLLKVGYSLNPLMRLASYSFDGEGRDPCLLKMVGCRDYLQCEVDIKKKFDNQEYTEWNKKNQNLAIKIMNKYKTYDLDPGTVEVLSQTNGIEKYFHGKN